MATSTGFSRMWVEEMRDEGSNSGIVTDKRSVRSDVGERMQWASRSSQAFTREGPICKVFDEY